MLVLAALIKISSVQKVEEIPLLGIGKTDYRKLQSLVAGIDPYVIQTL